MPYPQKDILVLISVTRLSKPQGHGAAGRIKQTEKKNSMTSSGLEPATFWLVA
jgi:hypothetical protein